MTKEYRNAPRLWPDPETGPWLVQLRWGAINGRAECVGIDITSARPEDVFEDRWSALTERMPETATPLTTSVLRNLRIGELIAEEREQMATTMGELVGPDDESLNVFGASGRTMRDSTRKRLQRVADTYRKAWHQGKPPVQTVAKRFGVSEAAASKLVFRARSAGMLPPTSSGVPAAAGGDVSPST